jgi:uncharacterized protein (TIGR00369 family)
MTRLGEPAIALRAAWDRLVRLPGGKRAFSKLLGAAAPYTGSIGAEVEEARHGRAVVKLADRRKLHNHLRSIHAAALANLVEMTGSLAIAFSLPKGARFIPTGLRIDYVKKARGTITAACDCPPVASNERAEYELPVELCDESGEEVARARLRVLVGPIQV